MDNASLLPCFSRVQKLLAERKAAERQAECLEYHADFASRALEMMQRLHSSRRDWSEVEAMIKEVG